MTTPVLSHLSHCPTTPPDLHKHGETPGADLSHLSHRKPAPPASHTEEQSR